MSTLLPPEQLLYVCLALAFLLLVLIVWLGISMSSSKKYKKALLLQESNVQALQSELMGGQLELHKAQSDLEDISKHNSLLLFNAEKLSPYASMPDAFAELDLKRGEVDTFRKDSKKLLQEKAAEANSILNQAKVQSDNMISNANIKAEKIAKEAWQAKDNIEFYKRTALAMKNKVSGYGDEYLIPNETLLHDLAEEFTHEEAGRQLKLAQSQAQEMIKNGTAADCDDKETLRRQKSIEFVLDAFNGKAETILARVKSDNYGIMKQKLADAAQLVNHNGMPFKNARILPKYSDLYQQQLKYAVQVKELKQRDRDEQRRIKADMREEERVQRELKKAQQQAEKEQKLIAEAVQEAEAKLAQSADAERSQFQAQLDALLGKLSDAEAKNQRAISMAQQTKQGHVYVISNVGSFGEHVFKVGMTRRLEPLDRVKELGGASVPFSFDVHAIIFSEDAPKLEQYLHTQFQHKRLNKVNPRKAFFNVALGEVRAEIEALDLKCHWTLKADALEFRESERIRKASAKEMNKLAVTFDLG